MLNLLKTFGKGILYVIGLPFFLLALVLFAVFGILAFLFQIIKSIIFFFTGQKFFPELPEDKELRLIKEAANRPANPEPQAPQNDSFQDIIMPFEQEPAQTVEESKDEPKLAPTIEDVCFNKAEEELPKKPEDPEDPDGAAPSLIDLLDDEPEEDTHIREEEPVEEGEETLVETSENDKDEEDLVEELETYVPRSSNYDAQVDDEEEDTDSGVNIDYDVR